MQASTLFLAGLSAALYGLGLWRDPRLAREGLLQTWQLFLQVAPSLFFAFLVVGIFQVLVPPEWIRSTIGEDSGARGILIAWGIGAFTPGGPFVNFTVLAGFLKLGAGMGPMLTFLTSWAVIGVFRALAWEIPILGLRFTLIRLGLSWFLPLLVGFGYLWVRRWLPA